MLQKYYGYRLIYCCTQVDVRNMMPVQRSVLEYCIEDGLVFTKENGKHKTYKFAGGRILENNSSNEIVKSSWADSMADWIKSGAEGELVEKGIF